MDLAEALKRIDAIHDHVARGEAYRGWHPHALAMSGIVGLTMAWVQPDLPPLGFVAWWTGAACLAAMMAGLPTFFDYVWQDGEAARRTRVICRQFVPCLLAGVVLTLAMAQHERLHACCALLPGTWALLYGLGTVASSPYLPRGAWLVAVWHLACGIVLLALAEGPVPSGWAVGVPFGVGQLLAAGVMAAGRRGSDGR